MSRKNRTYFKLVARLATIEPVNSLRIKYLRYSLMWFSALGIAHGFLVWDMHQNVRLSLCSLIAAALNPNICTGTRYQFANSINLQPSLTLALKT
jgi:hypothetical protein